MVIRRATPRGESEERTASMANEAVRLTMIHDYDCVTVPYAQAGLQIRRGFVAGMRVFVNTVIGQFRSTQADDPRESATVQQVR